MQQKITLRIQGMTCQACASRIEKVLNKKPYIQQATVNFACEQAQVSFDNSEHSPQDILQLIENVGFTGSLQSEQASPLEDTRLPSWRLWLLLLINLPFMFGMIGMLLGQHHWMLAPEWQFVLASIVQFGLAIPFYKSAWGSLKGGLANMDVLVSLGTLSIYFYSVFMLFTAYGHTHEGMPHVYFEASVMVLGFVSLGKFLEERTKKHSLNSLGLLVKLTPQQVNVQRDGQWQRLPLDQVQIGDLLRVKQGERIAADGIVQSGTGWSDESHLTGEFKPEMKKVGSQVLAGAMLSDGSLVYQAQQLGSQTLLGDMMNALSEAQGTKAPIARFADKVAAVFVPTVVVIALLTFAFTYWIKQDWVSALMHAVAVLVIACPCALGLATPAAIMVGMGNAVKHGIWFKDATAMEEAARVNAVVLDKTGTLTEGKPHIAAIWLAEKCGYSEEDFYRLAASVEQHASHPLAKAIVQHAQEKGIDLLHAEQIQTVLGAGIQAEVEGIGRVKVGKADYCHFTLPALADPIWQLASIVAVAVNDQPIGAFAIADKLKPDSIEGIKRLQAAQIEVYIMSGDQQSAVQYLADQLGINSAYGNLSPRDKANKIAQLQAEGNVVAMVGDGINDAPALARANVSFAMKNGADVAEHTASATLMQQSVNQMVDGLLLAQATLKNIKQNLFFAFIYNVLGIPIAACGLLNPIIAGAAMALSSVSVLMNALRLKQVKFNRDMS
ncbi:heavy metal translocating P-type ATPase [Pasteurella multocida]|uniref:heavy metal translocating P-type ATPase n=1 Tax=Pasteurella multocida TaxID=747 RepID=UPI000F6DCE2C|nr:cation-translocating P-type ATPase [Pasteurella multocida]VEJ15121.1 cation-transporting ATPase [Pasteurella multocida subsp. septica]HEA3246945.1 cation-translocating P-type ATPase [Pasteurella multocida]